MKSTNYTRFCRKFLSGFFERFDINETSKDRLLEKADIPIVYKEYFSMVIMNLIIGFIVSFISTIIIYSLFPNDITAILMLVVSCTVPFGIAMYYITLPQAMAKSRGKKIDRYLPYATNFINTMSVAGISPAEIFEALSKIELYKEIQKESKKITTEINMMGIDTITALNNAIKISPSEKFKEFIQGILSVIQSGSELGPYFERCVDKYMSQDILERKKNLESLAVMAESFVVTVIAFPLFLVIIISIMGLTSAGGVSFPFLYVIALMILPLSYVGFYVLMSSGMGESI